MLIPVHNRKSIISYALVDDDFPRDKFHTKWTLHTKGYVNGYVGSKRILLHQIVMGKKPGFHIDHINGNKLDNRRENLRHCTPLQNNLNTGPRRNHKTGCKGVQLTRSNTYSVSIKMNGIRRYLGTYKTLDEAILVRKTAEKELFKEFMFSP